MSDDNVIITPGDDRVIIVSNASDASVVISQGTAGPVGVPGLIWRGLWAGGTSYALDDVVYYNGSAWLATTTVGPDISPPLTGNDTSIYWTVLVRGWPVTFTVSHDAPPNPLFHDIWIQV